MNDTHGRDGIGWIGVDFDGTLVEYTGWKGATHIGKPVSAMVERVRKWIAERKDVRIFTARVSPGPDMEASRASIARWCIIYLGKELPITCIKDARMIELWDDRAVQVEPNTGNRIDGKE